MRRDDRSGSEGDEIRDGQFLPLTDRKADIAYEEIIVRRSNRFSCPLFPLLAVVSWAD